jgi:uncharacterized protein YjbJ (UPF0337 family)
MRHLGNLIGDARLAADGRAESRLGKAQETAVSARYEARDAPENKQAADGHADPWGNMRKD